MSENQNVSENNADDAVINTVESEIAHLLHNENKLDSKATINSKISLEDINDNKEFLDSYRKSLLKSTDIAIEYHKNEIESIRKIIKNLINFMWIFGTVSVVATVIFAYFKNLHGTIVTPAFSTIIETIFAMLTKVLDGTLRSKDIFFQEDIKMQKFDKILSLILTINESENKKNSLIEKIVDNYLSKSDE